MTRLKSWFLILGSLLLSHSITFAAERADILARPKPFNVGDVPGAVSSWSNFRGPEFEGYASIGKERSRVFWQEKLRKRGFDSLDPEAYMHLSQLWKARCAKSQTLRNFAANIGLESRPLGWPDIEAMLTAVSRSRTKPETYDKLQKQWDSLLDNKLVSDPDGFDAVDECRKGDLREMLRFEAQNLTEAYLDFKSVATLSSEERTTSHFDACRNRLVELVGEVSVQQLELSLKSRSKDSYLHKR